MARDRIPRNPFPNVVKGLCLCLAVLIAGCIPSRIVIDLAPGDGELEETEVLADQDAGLGSAKIALIDVNGIISHTPPPSLVETSANSVDGLVSRLNKAKNDPRVRAIVLRINSPGGTVAASETMYNEVLAFRERTGKPVVISMSEVSASGGYYLALAGDHIVAQKTSITGSIGVLFQTINVSSGLSMIGVQSRAITSGPNKDLANPLEEPVNEHFEIIQALVDDFYTGFRSRVVERRSAIPADRLDMITDGRVFTGSQARELGLVDSLGGLREAFAKAKELSGVPTARLVKYHAPGRTPTSPYALAPTGDAGGAGVDVSLRLGASAPSASGFYYLWIPPSR